MDFVEPRSARGHLTVRINLVRGAEGIHIQIVVQHVAEPPSAFTCYNVVGLHLFAQSVNQRIVGLAVFSSTGVQACALFGFASGELEHANFDDSCGSLCSFGWQLSFHTTIGIPSAFSSLSY